MTYRGRREAKAARLRGWAEGRAAKAEALHARNEPYRGDIAFNTQPGHIPERARAIARTERAWEHASKAAEMSRRADGIEAAADRAIYSDDPDAVERLRERVLELEHERTRWKEYNRAARTGDADALRFLDDQQRAEVASLVRIGRISEGGAAPGYVLTNLGGNITRNRKRLESLERRRREG